MTPQKQYAKWGPQCLYVFDSLGPSNLFLFLFLTFSSLQGRNLFILFFFFSVNRKFRKFVLMYFYSSFVFALLDAVVNVNSLHHLFICKK